MLNLSDVTLFTFDGAGNNTQKLISIIDLCKQKINFGQIVYFTSDLNHPKNEQITFIEIEKKSHQDYNKFMVLELNDYIQTGYCLVIQPDGYICNPENWTDEFLNYDYIGAPWWLDVKSNQGPWILAKQYNSELVNSEAIVGNGGFSLRSKKLLELLSKLDKKQTQEFLDNQIFCGHTIGEDLFISVILREYLNNNNCKIAPHEIAKKFSIEQTPEENIYFEKLFGFHGGDMLPIAEKYLREKLK